MINTSRDKLYNDCVSMNNRYDNPQTDFRTIISHDVDGYEVASQNVGSDQPTPMHDPRL